MTSITRKSFIRRSLLGAGVLVVGPSLEVLGSTGAEAKPGIEISLAEWSLHRHRVRGNTQPEGKGIRRTKALLERYL